MPAFRAIPTLLAALTLLLAGASPATAVAASDEVERCTDDGALLCVVASAEASISCGAVDQDGAVSCLAVSTWGAAGGSRLPASPGAQVQRGAEAILSICQGDLCLSMFILQETLVCRVSAHTPWCSVGSTMEEPVQFQLAPGECGTVELTSLVGARLFVEPRPVNNVLTGGAPLLEVLTAPTAVHEVCRAA